MSVALQAPALAPAREADFVFSRREPFRLAAGGTLQPVTLRYAVYGEPNARRDNVVLVCHALSGSHRAAEWWSELFGPGNVFDPGRDCVVCVNCLGSCYGSTGPGSTDPATGRPFGAAFPVVTVEDNVRAQAALLDHLGVERLKLVIGGSIGGMQVLRWAVEFPERVARCVAIGAAPLGALGLALNHVQRAAIHADPIAGLHIARAVAMCTYKSPELFAERFGRRPNRDGEDPRRSASDRFDVAGYLDHQGDIFTRRFTAESYVALTKTMDLFEPWSGYECEGAALARIEAAVLLVGISSDWLFPASDVRNLARRLRDAGVDARYAELPSSHGHDGFLADARDVAAIVLGERW